MFQWSLSETHTLENCGTLRLPADPLDISLASHEPTLLVAVNAGASGASSEQPASLLAYTPTGKNAGDWVLRSGSFNETAAERSVLDISLPDTKTLFYTVDNLRKSRAQTGEEEDNET